MLVTTTAALLAEGRVVADKTTTLYLVGVDVPGEGRYTVSPAAEIVRVDPPEDGFPLVGVCLLIGEGIDMNMTPGTCLVLADAPIRR